MAIADVYKTDYESLSKIIRKLNSLPDDVDSLKVLNALGAELHGWIARHNDLEGAEVLTAVVGRLSPDAKPLPNLLNEFRQILQKNDAAAADEAVGSMKFSFIDALEGLKEFLGARGIDPAPFEPPAVQEAAPAEVIARDEMIETTAVEDAGAPVEVAPDELLETTAVPDAGAPVETEADPELEPTAAPAVEPTPAGAPAAATKCEYCGYVYTSPPGKFCDNCGRVLSRFNIEKDEEIALKKCLKCGHRNPMEERLCKNCGELLRDAEF